MMSGCGDKGWASINQSEPSIQWKIAQALTICNSYEVMYTKYGVEWDNSFGENSQKPIDQSEASIQCQIIVAQRYAIALYIPP